MIFDFCESFLCNLGAVGAGVLVIGSIILTARFFRRRPETENYEEPSKWFT